jgi:hypothetical protein
VNGKGTNAIGHPGIQEKKTQDFFNQGVAGV